MTVSSESRYVQLAATYPMFVADPAPDAPRVLSPMNNEGEKGESGDRPIGKAGPGDMLCIHNRPKLIVAAIAAQAPTLTDDELFELDADWAGAFLEARQRGHADLASCARAVLAVLGQESDRRAMGRARRRAA